MIGNTRLQRSQSEGNLSNIKLSNDEFTKEFSFLFKSISEADINNAIKKGEYKKYKKLIADHNATFIESKKNYSSPLHVAVICNNKHANEVKETISAVLQSGIDINHLDEQGNTPLIHLLNEAAKSEKKYKKSNLTGVIKLLIERGASLESQEEWASGSDLIDTLAKKKVIDKKEIDDVINTAKKNLQEKAKEKLSEYIQDIKDVSIYGSCAKIQLNDDKNEFKISEFLQSDFCKNNGISGFSTFHDNGKSGMHGVVSSEGVRHYVVTDGSYEMTLNWPGNQKIKIHISADGTVKVDDEYLEQYRAGKIDVATNKDVKIGNLSLTEALEKGRWKENEMQNETIRSGDRSIDRGVAEPIRENNFICTLKKEQFQPVMTSTPISEERQRAKSEPAITSTSTPEGRQRSASEPVMTTSTPIPGAQPPNFYNVSPIHNDTPDGTPEGPERNERSKSTPSIRRSSLPQNNYVGTSASQSSVPIITVADNAQIYPNRLKEDSRLVEQSWNEQEENVLSNQQQTAVKLPVAINNGGDTPIKDGSKFAEEKRTKVDSTQIKILTPDISSLSQSFTNRFSFHDVIVDPRMSPKKLTEEFEQRKASLQKERKKRAEQNSENRVYNLQLLFTDQHIKSDSTEYTAGSQPSTKKEELGLNNADFSTLIQINQQSPIHPEQPRKNIGQGDPTPFEELKKRLSQPTLGLKQINPNETGNNDSGYSSPTIADHPSQINLKQLKENLSHVKQDAYTKVDDPTQFEKTFDQEKYGLKSVDSSSMSEQTRKRLLEDGLLKDTQIDAKTVDNSTSTEHSPTTLLSNSGSDSGYSSPTHTNHGKLQVNPEQLKENLRNVGQNELTLLEEFFSKLDENKKFPLNPVDPDKIGNNRVEDESEPLKKFKQGLKPVDLNDISEQTRKRLLEDGLLQNTQTNAKTVDNSTSSEQSSDPKQSTTELRTHNIQGSKGGVNSDQEKSLTYSENFNQGSLNFNREYYNTSSLFDENEQKTAKLNNTQSSPAEQVMNELKEALKKPGKGLKESTQNAEKNIPLVNSHNPFLEQISKDIEGGKLKKGTLKNWVERVQQQESNKGRSV